MKQSRKEFIKRAHLSACDDWKKLIEAEFTELFKPEIEVGKWYKADWYLFYLTGFDNSKKTHPCIGYGFSCGELNGLIFKDGKWASIIEEEKPSLSFMEINQIPEDIKNFKQDISKLEIQFAKIKDKIDKL